MSREIKLIFFNIDLLTCRLGVLYGRGKPRPYVYTSVSTYRRYLHVSFLLGDSVTWRL